MAEMRSQTEKEVIHSSFDELERIIERFSARMKQSFTEVFDSRTEEPAKMIGKISETPISAIKDVPERIRASSLHRSSGTLKPTRLIPLQYSWEEVNERREKGLCIFCEENETPDHHLKHKGLGLVFMDVDDHSFNEEVVERPSDLLMPNGEETLPSVMGFEAEAIDTDVQVTELFHGEESHPEKETKSNVLYQIEAFETKEQQATSFFKFTANEIQIQSMELVMRDQTQEGKSDFVSSPGLSVKRDGAVHSEVNHVWKPGELVYLQGINFTLPMHLAFDPGGTLTCAAGGNDNWESCRNVLPVAIGNSGVFNLSKNHFVSHEKDAVRALPKLEVEDIACISGRANHVWKPGLHRSYGSDIKTSFGADVLDSAYTKLDVVHCFEVQEFSSTLGSIGGPRHLAFDKEIASQTFDKKVPQLEYLPTKKKQMECFTSWRFKLKHQPRRNKSCCMWKQLKYKNWKFKYKGRTLLLFDSVLTRNHKWQQVRKLRLSPKPWLFKFKQKLIRLKIRDKEFQIAMLLAPKMLEVHHLLNSLVIAEAAAPIYPTIEYLSQFFRKVGIDKEHSSSSLRRANQVWDPGGKFLYL